MEPLRILVVDDEKDLVEIIAARLRAEGFLVETACEPAKGLELAGSFQPHAILLDVSMPAMDGWEFCRRLAANAGGAVATPVLIMTAWLTDDLRRRAADVGASRVFLKPFDEKEVIAAVHALAAA